LWSLAYRVLQLPYLLLQSLIRVSFPVMSHLVAAKEDAAPIIQRSVAMVAVGSGVILTGLAGSAPGLFPGLFGEQWRDASLVVPGACFGIAVGESVAVSTQGYLYAVGDAGAILRASILQAVALLGVTLALVPVLGVAAVGLGSVAAGTVQAYMLRRALLRWVQVDVLRPLIRPVAVGVLSSGVGWFVSDAGGSDLGSGLLGGTCSVLLFIGLLSMLSPRLIRETFSYAVVSVRAAVRGVPPQPARS
jgi:O-antigen/teichoic acid export membrane protein